MRPRNWDCAPAARGTRVTALSSSPPFTNSIARPYRANASAGFCASIVFRISVRFVDILRATIPGNGVPVFLPRGAIRNQPLECAAAFALGRRVFGRMPRSGKHPSSPMKRACAKSATSGYGRHGCEQFPADSSAADAIRFHVAKDAGELIHIQYVFEKDCWPVEHGTDRQRRALHDCHRNLAPPGRRVRRKLSEETQRRHEPRDRRDVLFASPFPSIPNSRFPPMPTRSATFWAGR